MLGASDADCRDAVFSMDGGVLCHLSHPNCRTTSENIQDADFSMGEGEVG